MVSSKYLKKALEEGTWLDTNLIYYYFEIMREGCPTAFISNPSISVSLVWIVLNFYFNKQWNEYIHYLLTIHIVVAFSVCRAGGRMDLMLVLKLPSVSKVAVSGKPGSAIHWCLSYTTGTISHWLWGMLMKGGVNSITVWWVIDWHGVKRNSL